MRRQYDEVSDFKSFGAFLITTALVPKIIQSFPPFTINFRHTTSVYGTHILFIKSNMKFCRSAYDTVLYSVNSSHSSLRGAAFRICDETSVDNTGVC